MPAGGLWGIDAETTGAPGRGIQIEVENGIVVLTYYGYRLGGSSGFLLASGPIVNNVFSADLFDYQGGTVFGGPYQPAQLIGSAGRVNISFSSGLHGTITLPGESPKAISKLGFGYGNNPDSLLGTWLLTYIGVTSIFSDKYTLTTVTGQSTSNGNGLVTSSSGDFACENIVSGSLAGQIMCTEGVATYDDSYFFKMSGDRGSGVGWFMGSSGTLVGPYQLHVLRTAIRSGQLTGVNDGTVNSLQAKAQVYPATGKSDAADELKAGEPQHDAVSEERSGVENWAEEAKMLLERMRNQ